MRDAVRALVVMVEISVSADAPRSIGAVVTAVGSNVALPLRAIGLKMLTDGIVASNLTQGLTGITLIVGLTALSRLMFWASFNIRMRLRENTQMYLDAHIMDLTAGIPGLEHHERPEYLDNVELVRAGRWALANPFNPISWSLAGIFQVASVFVLLGGIHPLLILLPLGGIPSILATLYSQRAATRLRESQAEPNRLLRHLQDLTTDAAAAKEVRVFGLSELLLQRRQVLFGELERVRVRQRVRLTLLTAGAWAFFSVCFVAAIAFTVDLATRDEVSVGAVTLVLALGAQVNMLLAMLVSNIAWLSRTQSAVVRLLWLRDYAAQAHRGVAPAAPARVPDELRDGIRLSGVSFTYPGTDNPVLEGVHLHLPAGSTIAIVGENGAGKTTLVKLLSRFYEPTAGTISVDGVELRQLPVLEWRSRLAAGFQDFARLQLLARESIGVGDTDKIDRDAWIHAALERAAAADVAAALPHDLDTQLGRSFGGGVDLSLGQWQKVALGRAMMRERILLLMLDEPTASLDAPTEHALFEHFAQAARTYAAGSGAVTLLVSHRFSTVRMADLILVIAGGRIVEHGSHAELVGRGGLYAELYGLQASAYR
ncbi:MAG: ABC transporter ATP-binding protein/permease [Chloroflexota bacterium]|nr:ABC transporter ATP-binding protein/permease [Chloroflexota bacterium]